MDIFGTAWKIMRIRNTGWDWNVGHGRLSSYRGPWRRPLIRLNKGRIRPKRADQAKKGWIRPKNRGSSKKRAAKDPPHHGTGATSRRLALTSKMEWKDRARSSMSERSELCWKTPWEMWLWFSWPSSSWWIYDNSQAVRHAAAWSDSWQMINTFKNGINAKNTWQQCCWAETI